MIRRRARLALGRWANVDLGPVGQLATAQRWLGCNTPRCGLCRPSKRWHRTTDRQAAERQWRDDYEV